MKERLKMKFKLVENSHLQKDKWVVVNIEPRLSSYARLVPVKVSFIPNDGKIQFFGWANGERQHEYSTSSIVYQASSEEDANDYMECTPTILNMPDETSYLIYYEDPCGDIQSTGITVNNILPKLIKIQSLSLNDNKKCS